MMASAARGKIAKNVTATATAKFAAATPTKAAVYGTYH
jgi:hypothetical protein